MNMCILLSPCAFLATDYILLVGLAYTLDEKVRRRCLPIRPRYIVRLFVGSDISTFLLQGCGGGLTAIGASVGGIRGQYGRQDIDVRTVSSIRIIRHLHRSTPAFRMATTKRFSTVMAASKALPIVQCTFLEPVADWRLLYFIVRITCIGIIIRSVFRIVEFSGVTPATSPRTKPISISSTRYRSGSPCLYTVSCGRRDSSSKSLKNLRAGDRSPPIPIYPWSK
ncbi:hypothetical protein DFH07DRAFT_311753 [Mycena maculata]|uniref:Uncharacterized protein n=1 Tax=Mycena maculata TaxID=230809 RepID=A0AAD7NMY9_9AGAR|nr:hypothetical protein DFH07DRAFT_311753 [Mycena maculata]